LIFKVLIADDNEGMRLVLKKAIEKLDGFELTGEAGDGKSALGLAESLKPHIIFMDVEMPGLNGVECAKQILDINPKVFIIFATGHEEYMPDAFELYAFDYMIKPFKVERIHQTLKRIRDLHYSNENTIINRVIRHEKGLEKLIIKNKESISFVDMDRIILVERENRSTVIHTAGERYVTSEGLSEFEERLDKALFFRCHKSYIINLSMISKIYPYGRWTYCVKLKDTDRDALLTSDKYEGLQKMFR